MLIEIRTRWTNAFRNFGRRKDGVAAIEFALVAAPFFLLLTAMGEVGAMSLAQSNLNLAMAEMSRRIRTGEVQTAELSEAQVRDDACAAMRNIMPLECDDRFFIDVDTYEAFADVQITPPINAGEFQQGEMDFDPGSPSDIVVVRGYYRWHVLTPFFENVFANVGSGERLLSSAIMFRNEPFPEA